MNCISNFFGSPRASKIPSTQVSQRHPTFFRKFEPQFASPYRQVFSKPDLKQRFEKLLKQQFCKLDEKKVLVLMDQLLSDQDKTDEMIYKQLVEKIPITFKFFREFGELQSSRRLTDYFGKVSSDLLEGLSLDQFHDYAEIQEYRYLNSLRKITQLPLDGKIFTLCHKSKISLTDRLQAGVYTSTFPYRHFIELHDHSQVDPLLSPEETYRPIPAEMRDQSVDLILCPNGLNEIPSDRLENFVKSMHRVLRPGGVLLIREHDLPSSEINLKKLTSMVYSVRNAVRGVSWEAESKAVRNFKSHEEWCQKLMSYGFREYSINDFISVDPTENRTMALIRNPTNCAELLEAARFYGHRSKVTRLASWLEHRRQRSFEEYVEFIQHHHVHAFDYIGHMRQNWRLFFKFLKELYADPEVNFKRLIFSNHVIMNLLILTLATLKCCIQVLTNLPRIVIARCRYGKQWRTVANLSALEKFEAKCTSEYAQCTHFYKFENLTKIKAIWRAIWTSQDSIGIKLYSSLFALPASLQFGVNAFINLPIRKWMISIERQQKCPTVPVIVHDPDNTVKGHLSVGKDKLISVSSLIFTKFCNNIIAKGGKILEIAGQKEVVVDILREKEPEAPLAGVELIYNQKKLQDPDNRSYLTYKVQLHAFKEFQAKFGKEIVQIYQ